MIALTAFFQGTFRPVFQSEVFKYAPDTERWETSGIMSALVSLAMTMSPPIAGWLLEKNYSPFLFSAIMSLVAVLIFIFVLAPEIPEEQTPTGEH